MKSKAGKPKRPQPISGTDSAGEPGAIENAMLGFIELEKLMVQLEPLPDDCMNALVDAASIFRERVGSLLPLSDARISAGVVAGYLAVSDAAA